MWPFSSIPRIYESKQQQEASCASPGTAADELRPEQQHAVQLDAAHGWSWWRSPSPASSPPGTSSDGISSSSSSRSSTAAAAASPTGQAAAADAPPANSHHASQQPGTSQRGWSSWWRTQSGSSSSSLPSPAAAAVTAATATLSSTFPAQATQAGFGALQGSKQAIADPSSGSSTNQQEQQQQQQQQQQQRPSARSLETVEVQPLHVVLAGTAVMAVGAAFAGMSTYRAEAKSLAADGINPEAQLKIIPVALKTLLLSTVLTGCLGVAGFAVLKSSGLITADRAEIPSAHEVARFMHNPKGFVAELLAGEQQREKERKAVAAAQGSS